MEEVKGFVVSKKFRKWLYPVAIAVVGLAVGYGILTEEEASLWVGAIAAILGLGTASAHVVDDDKIATQKLENKTRKQDKEVEVRDHGFLAPKYLVVGDEEIEVKEDNEEGEAITVYPDHEIMRGRKVKEVEVKEDNEDEENK